MFFVFHLSISCGTRIRRQDISDEELFAEMIDLGAGISMKEPSHKNRCHEVVDFEDGFLKPFSKASKSIVWTIEQKLVPYQAGSCR